jgi:small-conductance mechanosensitive channel
MNKLLSVFLLFIIGASIFLPLSVQAQERVHRDLSPDQKAAVQEFKQEFDANSNKALEQYRKERDAEMIPRIITMGIIVIVASLIPYVIFRRFYKHRLTRILFIPAIIVWVLLVLIFLMFWSSRYSLDMSTYFRSVYHLNP